MTQEVYISSRVSGKNEWKTGWGLFYKRMRAYWVLSR